MSHAALPGPRDWPDPPVAGSTLRQCIALALLLHVLVVLVFGNTEGGSARPGQGVWGTLNIRLAGNDVPGRGDATVPSDAYSGPQGQARERRWGGAVRAPQDRPEAHSAAGAARQGAWQPQPVQPLEPVQPVLPQAVPDATPPRATEAPPAVVAELPAVAVAAPPPAPATTSAVAQPVPDARPVAVPEPAPDRLPLVARASDAATAVTPWRLPAPAAAGVQDLPLPALNLPAAPPLASMGAAAPAPAPAPAPASVLPAWAPA